MAVGGHLRSLILASIERAYANSYQSLIVTLVYLAPLLRYSHLLAENYDFFIPHSHLTPSLGVNPFEFLDELFVTKTRVLGLSPGEDFVILACVVLTQCQRVSDGRTDGWTTRPQLIQGSAKQAILTPCKIYKLTIRLFVNSISVTATIGKQTGALLHFARQQAYIANQLALPLHY